MTTALYPGSFDPITFGHIDLITRALKLFDSIVVAVGENPAKLPLFTVKERVDMIRRVTKGESGVEVDHYQGLTVHYARDRQIHTVIRSLRTTGEFETELGWASANRRLLPELEAVYFLPNPEYAHLSSTVVREIAQFGGDLAPFVPPSVESALRQKFSSI